uniref:Uncharacterized protein n=1 Tax=Glossina brevipalpis TaxID=37001 RepID=A0A1A9WDY5_9MUSC
MQIIVISRKLQIFRVSHMRATNFSSCDTKAFRKELSALWFYGSFLVFLFSPTYTAAKNRCLQYNVMLCVFMFDDNNNNNNNNNEMEVKNTTAALVIERDQSSIMTKRFPDQFFLQTSDYN